MKLRTPDQALRELLKVRKAVGRDNLPLNKETLMIDINLNTPLSEMHEAWFDYKAKEMSDLKMKI